MPVNAKLNFKSGEKAGTIYLIEQDEIILGRDNQCDVVIDNVEISRRHAQINFSNGQFYINDLNSTNGTLINGRAINKAEALKNGDIITIGEKDIIEISMEFDDDLLGITDSSSKSEATEIDKIVENPKSDLKTTEDLAEKFTDRIKGLPVWALILIVASIFLVLFCLLPLLIIEITNQWCNLFSSFFNAINPGLCP